MKNHSIHKQKISYICTPTNLQAHGRHLHPYSLLQDTLHLLRFLLHHPQRTEKPLYPCVVQGVADAERISEGEPVETIYFGGGTPSQLAEEDFREVFETIRKYYGMEHCREITLEANPDDLTEAYAAMLQNLPFNRISMGIQTFDDSTLKLLNRRHNAAQAVNAVKHCRHAGFNNISIDLIYGLPGETDERWKRDLQQAVSLNVEHISAYHLTYEEGTRIYELLQAHRIREVDEESSVRFFSTLINTLGSAGYEHYEISISAVRTCIPATIHLTGKEFLTWAVALRHIHSIRIPANGMWLPGKIHTCHRKQSTLVRTGAFGPDHLL